MGELLKESYDLRVDASNQRGLSLDAPPVSLALPVSPVSARNPSPSSNATTYNAGPAIPQIPETIRPAPALIQTANPPIPPIPPSPTALAPSAFPIPIDPRPSTTSKKLIKASDVEINYARPLGEGGFGMVYVGLLKNSVPVAVKELRRKGNEKEFQAFLKEVETWDGLAQNHSES